MKSIKSRLEAGHQISFLNNKIGPGTETSDLLSPHTPIPTSIPTPTPPHENVNFAVAGLTIGSFDEILF